MHPNLTEHEMVLNAKQPTLDKTYGRVNEKVHCTHSIALRKRGRERESFNRLGTQNRYLGGDYDN